MKIFSKLLMIALFSSSCSNNYSTDVSTRDNLVLISAKNKFQKSTTAGNLIGEAILHEHKLDVVLYPAPLLDESKEVVLDLNDPSANSDDLQSLYPNGAQDQFIVGTLTGQELKRLVKQRADAIYKAELQTVGLQYNFKYLGGLPVIQAFTDENNNQLDDKKEYKVAVSHYFYSNIFPGYRLGNSLENAMQREKIVSAKESLSSFLTSELAKFSDYSKIRSAVENIEKSIQQGIKSISEIQGIGHVSPYIGNIVTVSGVVTAIAAVDRYYEGYDIIIQSQTEDDDPRTSEGLHIYLDGSQSDIKVGDLIKITGTVFESIAHSDLGKTTLRNIKSYEIKKSGLELPQPTKLGKEYRNIPTAAISTFKGDLNKKDSLNLEDGIDFWESLEGMRISFSNPTILGFRGGEVDTEDELGKSYINLYMTPNEYINESDRTRVGGLINLDHEHNYNPEVLQIAWNHLSSSISNKYLATVGDTLSGEVTGILSYEKNIFGDGEYVLLLTESQEVFNNPPLNEAIPLKDRPVTKFESDTDNITVATFNIENLSGEKTGRIKALGEAITTNLKCPDILNLVEVQDNNGVDFDGGSAANETLENIIAATQCSFTYKSINIDPVVHNEGGQPGGNIRVAMIYNSNKLTFNQKQPEHSLVETFIDSKGQLNANPGRVFPNDPAFKNSRRSLIVEFGYKNQRIFVIGNHFKSKLGDGTLWGNLQPPQLTSDNTRSASTKRINDFVKDLEKVIPDAHIIVLGDFNATHSENSLRILAGNELQDLMQYKDLWPKNSWYTTNHNGSSQTLDYIYANKKLLKRDPQFEILHINSDYMGRISDHDPVIAEFTFK